MQLLSVPRFIWQHPANSGRRLRTLTRSVLWQIDKRLTGRPWDLRLPNGLMLRCYPNSTSASLALYTNGLVDYDEVLFLQGWLRPGDGFLDVGANIGVYSLLAAGVVGARGFVDAFEFEATAVARLKENLALNQLEERIRVHRFAASDRSGTGAYCPDGDTGSRLVEDARGGRAAPVCTVALDEATAGHRYAMGKIDVEGSEVLVLLGASRMLSEANPPVWIFEVNPRRLQDLGFTAHRLIELWEDHGYELARYGANQKLLTTGPSTWQGRKGVFNLLALARAECQRIALAVGADLRTP